nr:unnamed protein product [Digitaria exilis]
MVASHLLRRHLCAFLSPQKDRRGKRNGKSIPSTTTIACRSGVNSGSRQQQHRWTGCRGANITGAWPKFHASMQQTATRIRFLDAEDLLVGSEVRLGHFQVYFTVLRQEQLNKPGMGTKVEGTAYIPGYFDMADSSVNSNGNALPYYKEKKPSVHFSDRFTITSSDGSVHYDKEMLKRTMLVHEATFRKQVYELHRLYKTQKELMAQLQRKEFSCSPRYADALQPGSSASQLPADVYAEDDDDDDVGILEVRPSKSSPWANESNSTMAWYPQNSMGSSMEHYPPSASTFNHLIFAPPSFNHAVNPSRQSNNTSYFTKSHYGAVETSIAKHAHSSGILMDSTPTAPYHHSLKIHEEAPDQKLPPLHRNLKDIDLNDAPVDTVATWEQQSDISWLCKKPYDLNIGSSIKSEADMELQPQRKEVGTDIRNLIDLNEALPIMDDPEMDACGSGELVPREPNDPSSDSLAIKAAENLVAICNVVVQPASPQVDTLHWFADLATSKENTTLDKDSDDDFEALTMKLQETKSNEYHSTPRATQEDNRHNGPCSAASLLIPKPQRGKGRGRRQRKDFHRDVLPCIASLQKNEVSEDLCALGRPKPVTPSKRGGRNGQQPRARRRVRRVAVAMAVEEAEVGKDHQTLSKAKMPAGEQCIIAGIEELVG